MNDIIDELFSTSTMGVFGAGGEIEGEIRRSRRRPGSSIRRRFSAQKRRPKRYKRPTFRRYSRGFRRKPFRPRMAYPVQIRRRPARIQYVTPSGTTGIRSGSIYREPFVPGEGFYHQVGSDPMITDKKGFMAMIRRILCKEGGDPLSMRKRDINEYASMIAKDPRNNAWTRLKGAPINRISQAFKPVWNCHTRDPEGGKGNCYGKVYIVPVPRSMINS